MARATWHQEWFDGDYLKLYSHRNPQEADLFLRFLEETCTLIPSKKTPLWLADLGCGAGRHSINLATQGHRVIALDWSRHLLQQGKKDAAQLPPHQQPIFLQGDLLHLPLTSGFDWVLSLFTSFGYNRSDTSNENQLAEMTSCLKPGGRLLIDFLNPTFLRNSLVKKSERWVGELLVREERAILEDLNMVEKVMHFGKKGEAQRKVIERVKLYDSTWFQKRLPQFKLLEHFGELNGSSFHSESTRSILLLEKKGTQ